MTRLIRNDGIGRELSTRFDLDVSGPYDPLTIPPTVQLIHPVDDLLLELHGLQDTANQTTLQSIWTVPTGERWHLLNMNTYRAQAGGITFMLVDPITGAYQVVGWSGASNYAVINFPQKFVLSAGWEIDIYALPGTAGTIRNSIMYQLERVV